MPPNGAGARSRLGHRTLVFDLSVGIRVPPSTIYALLADIQEAEPIPRSARVRMRKRPSGPTRVGTHWQEAVRLAPAVWLRTRSVVTVAAPPYRLGMDFRGLWFTGHLTYQIEATADGSVLHQRERLRPRRLLRPFGTAIARRLEPRLRERLTDIRTLLEGSDERKTP